MEEEVRSVIDELVATRRRIVEVLFEIDEIRLQVNPQILAEYAGAVGYLETDLYSWQLKARRLRRKAILLRAALNRGETLSDKALDATLDTEFEAWQQELSRLMAEQLDRLEYLAGSRPLSPSETAEAKRLHRMLVKRLHPDIHPGQTDEERRFFAIAQAAYEAGDLQGLRAVATATEHLDEPLDSVGAGGGEQDAAVDLVMAEAQLNVLVDQLEGLKSSYPHILRELLGSPRELARVRRDLKARIAEQRKVAEAYEEAIRELREEKR
ncbi:hypothetical protein [Caniella muris]|uniref:hypothetical protein n=1 Tax=Caniella muris TaxID=2941502 RepID=UPI00203D154A|nr:hypothetical protein [Caniella muris]